MEIIFKQLEYEYDVPPFTDLNIEWEYEPIIETLIELVKKYDEKEHTDKEGNPIRYSKILRDILKEQLSEYPEPNLLSDDVHDRRVQKDFAKFVLNKMYEPKGQRYMDFPEYENIHYPEPSYAFSSNWYKKNLDKTLKNVIIAQKN